MARMIENVMMIEPELADNDEADQPAQELRQKIEELVRELGDAAMIGERWDLELQNEQRDDDGENAVAERLDAIEAKLAPGETAQQ